jgi:hypothetical protein
LFDDVVALIEILPEKVSEEVARVTLSTDLFSGLFFSSIRKPRAGRFLPGPFINIISVSPIS